MKRVTVRYYARLREERGCSEEPVSTGSATAEELFNEVTGRHNLAWDARSMRVAVNGSVAPWSASLRDGDRVEFLPPMSGG